MEIRIISEKTEIVLDGIVYQAVKVGNGYNYFHGNSFIGNIMIDPLTTEYYHVYDEDQEHVASMHEGNFSNGSGALKWGLVCLVVSF